MSNTIPSDQLSSARGCLLGTAIALVMWAAIIGLVIWLVP